MVRLHDPDIAALDNWRGQQEGLPSRPEAIRRLVEKALGQAAIEPATHDALVTLFVPGLDPLGCPTLKEAKTAFERLSSEQQAKASIQDSSGRMHGPDEIDRLFHRPRPPA